MERIPTGIKGLDDMLEGGVPKRRHVALYGGPGTGKTSFGFEFLLRGALRGEPGLYLTLEEGPEDIIENMKSQFSGLADKIDESIKEESLIVERPKDYTLESLAEALENRILENNVERAVIDSSTMVKAMFPSEAEYRKSIVEFFNLLKTLDCTSFVIVEAETSRREEIRFEIEHYVLDGVINLYSLDRGDTRVRALEIFKMRGTNHSRDLVPYKVLPEGIKVYVGEKVF